MKFVNARAVALAALFGLVSCNSSPSTPAPTPDPRAGTWHVRNGFVRDPSGRAVVLRGLNLAGAHKNTPYFSFQMPPDYARVQTDWGMNSIRFLVVWAAIEPTKGVYDDAFLDQVATRMQWAHDAGLSVIVDMHQDIYGEGFGGGDGAPKWTCDQSRYDAYVPRTPWFLSNTDPNVIACYDGFWNSDELQSHYAEAWRRLAARLKDAPAVIGFDPMNEPYWGSAGSEFEVEKLLPLYAKVVTAVRGEAPNWIAFAEPSAAHNLGLGTHIESFPFDNVAFAPHSYDADAESGNGFNPKGHDALMETIEAFKDESDALGTSLWIGEYGGTPNDGLISYMDAEFNGAGAIAAGQQYWAYDEGGGYSILNADGTERPQVTASIVRPFPDKTAGDPVSFAFDAATNTFTFTYKPDRSIADPTEISIPARTYPTGFQLDCGGCASTMATNRLLITSPAAGASVTITLTPKS